MPSDHRLHPFSIVFAFLSQLKAFVLPGLLLLIGAGSRGGDWWQPWMMVLVIPTVIFAAIRYAFYRYRYDDNELVIRSGMLFRNERHIPYARIQNIDAVQRPLHRILNVVEVRIETGSGPTPEATMSVLPLSAFQEMRRRVFAERRVVESTEAAITPAGESLLELNVRDLLLCGFIENRGAVIIAAGFGVVYEFGFVDRLMGRIFGDEGTGRRMIRDLVRESTRKVDAIARRLAISVAALVGLLIFIRILSMVWAVVRLYGFRLTLAGEDLRTEYGLFTRVTATIPLRRIQTLSVREGPWHRLCERVAVRVDTAGGRPHEGGRTDREWLAPILRRDSLPQFVQHVMRGAIDLGEVAWRGVAPGAFRREVKGWLVLALILQAGAFWIFSWWAFAVAPLLLAWAVIMARQTVKHLGWAISDEAVFFRSGWLRRRVNVVRFAKIQTVTLAASPFDRRTAMARVRVDTAGASESSRINIPYLEREVATDLYNALAREAERRQFTW